MGAAQSYCPPNSTAVWDNYGYYICAVGPSTVEVWTRGGWANVTVVNGIISGASAASVSLAVVLVLVLVSATLLAHAGHR